MQPMWDRHRSRFGRGRVGTGSTRLRRTGQANVALRSLSRAPCAPFDHPVRQLRVMPTGAS
ncbi:MAG: hypothetical protein ACK5X3_24500, partial [Pseudomonadota bacterium]